jgi:hypothetical protein
MRLLIFFMLSLLVLADSCVDRLYIADPEAAGQLVVEGSITDEPGPYTIKLSRATGIGGQLTQLKTVSANRVTIFDNLGNSEILQPVVDGTYQTSPGGIQGVIGRDYYIRLETRDGKVYESTPEKITPPGKVDSVYFQFVSSLSSDGTTQYGFKIFANTSGDPSGENLFRWRFTGTYRVVTHPELQSDPAGEGRVPNPPACSGYIYVQGLFENVGPCECCTCWPNIINSQINLSDNNLSSTGKYTATAMGYVPVEYWTFYDKVMVTVKQMSLSQSAFNYWKIVRDQLGGATSLFQPSIGKAKSNIYLKDGNEEVQGYFYAAGIAKKVLFINVSDIPLGPGIIPKAGPSIEKSCLAAFPNSSNQQPADWK